MTAVAHAAALVVTVAGLAAAAALARRRQIPLALAILLDFFTAASLLRLAGPPGWPALGMAALTIVIRQLASRILRAAAGRADLRAGVREAFRRH